MYKNVLDEIDVSMFLRPPVPKGWEPQSCIDLRFGWDDGYKKKYGQDFSPWFFAKNACAVLGYVRMHGPSDLMEGMAENLVKEMTPYLDTDGANFYIKNSFNFTYLWRNFKTPFYGAFMNSVTSYGLMHLYEATNSIRYLLLAQGLLSTVVNREAVIPLSTEADGKIWLHEYVWKSEIPAPSGIETSKGWNCSKIYNGHAHALLGLMRFQAMTGVSYFNEAIEGSLEAVKRDFPEQIFEGRYFSYCRDTPIMPDYGQERAWRLVRGLAAVTGDSELKKLEIVTESFFRDNVMGREHDIFSEGRAACREYCLKEIAGLEESQAV